MKIRTIGMIASLMVFSMITIGGCTTTYKQMKDWEGRTINDLYWEWGKPDEVVGANTGGRVYTWYSTWEDDGEEKTCRKSFTTSYDGHDEVIIDTSYENCHFLTIK